jgi:hypothetical protein
MDDQLLNHLYHRLCAPDKVQRPGNCVYSDSVIVLIYFLGVLRERSPHWAHDKQHWPLWLRRLKRPSYSQFAKRLNTPSVQQFIDDVNEEFRGQLPSSLEKFCDGKPLVVGGFSRDPDTACGKLPGDGWGRGYKLHVIVDACGAVDVFALTALDAGEATVARRLVALVDLSGVLLRGDSNYDSNPLYGAVAARGGRLIAPRKRPHTGLGHQPHHPDRLRAIAELEQRGGGGGGGEAESTRAHKRHRIRVEQALGHLTNLPCGLSPLPNFVRRKHRVARWVLAKITLYHLALILRPAQKLAA